MYLNTPDSKDASRLLPQFPCEYALSCQLVAPGTEQQYRDVYLAEKHKNKLSGCIKIQVVNQSSVNSFFFWWWNNHIWSFVPCEEGRVRRCLLGVNCPEVKSLTVQRCWEAMLLTDYTKLLKQGGMAGFFALFYLPENSETSLKMSFFTFFIYLIYGLSATKSELWPQRHGRVAKLPTLDRPVYRGAEKNAPSCAKLCAARGYNSLLLPFRCSRPYPI